MAEQPAKDPTELSDGELHEVIYQCAGAACGPLLADNPDYTFPADRVTEAIAACLEEFNLGHLARPAPETIREGFNCAG